MNMAMMTMKLLDLCCCGGGASTGYARAGFDVVGVDIDPQPGYPFEFWQMNALDLDYEKLGLFDVIHASPPCHKYSKSTAVARRRGKVYPDLYAPFKRMLVASGKPYVIENVLGSPVHGIGLCGTMFGLHVFRHRVFESNVTLVLPDTPCTCSKRRIGAGYYTVAGDASTKAQGMEAMGLDWRLSKYQVRQAIPPAYTEFIGRQIIRTLGSQEKPTLLTLEPGSHEKQLLMQLAFL